MSKRERGRPSKIETIDLSRVEFLASEGYTDKQLAEIFKVTPQTVSNWKLSFPRFFESLKAGKMLADAKVEASLYQRACGYSHPDVHIGAQGKITPIVKHYPPDTTACIFWLKNRKRAEWRDTQDIDHKVSGGLFDFLKGGTGEENGEHPKDGRGVPGKGME